MKKILVITGRPQFFNFFREDHTSDFQTFIISDAKEAYSTLISQRFDLAFIDETLIPQKDSSQESSNKTKIKFLKDLYPMMPIVLLAEQNEAHNIVPLARLYSLGYLCYPFTKEEVYLSIEKTLKDQIQRAEIEYLRDHFWIPESLPIVSTKNPKMSEL